MCVCGAVVPLELQRDLHPLTTRGQTSTTSINCNSTSDSFISRLAERTGAAVATYMAPRDASQDRTNTPDPVDKGIATLATLRCARPTLSLLGCLLTRPQDRHQSVCGEGLYRLFSSSALDLAFVSCILFRFRPLAPVLRSTASRLTLRRMAKGERPRSFQYRPERGSHSTSMSASTPAA